MFGANTSQTSSANYIEDVFSTYLYAGNGSTQTITNGIDLSGKGGLVWIKRRNDSGTNHWLMDTERLPVNSFFTYRRIITNGTNANLNYQEGISSFNSSGFVLDKAPDGGSAAGNNLNSSGQPFVSWTFRKQPKFFDIVTYTGDGATLRSIPHNLQSKFGAIFIKSTSATGNWFAWCRASPSSGSYLVLDSNAAQITTGDLSSLDTFLVGINVPFNTNINGVTYVAYLFAHDAGGFGNAGTDNVISCGSFAGGGTVSLGWEPQFILWKTYDGTGPWLINDNMRGLPTGGTQPVLLVNASDAETTNTFFDINATGFKHLGSGGNYIYIAIRRGPMKTPTVGTSVFGISYLPPTQRVDTGVLTDMMLFRTASYAPGEPWFTFDRVRGGSVRLLTNTTDTETTGYLPTYLNMDFGYQTGVNNIGSGFASGLYLGWGFKRSAGFFDVVNFEVAGITPDTVEPHNLTVVPELCIFKPRSQIKDWLVWHKDFGTTTWAILNTNAAAVNTGAGSMPVQTATTFGVNSTGFGFTSFLPCIAYLFASCPGVSKVGSYTGNGSSQTINCGFTTGARFILIKRTDNTGDWYVWDSARGIVAGNDPHLRINTTAAEITTDDSVDTDSTGFIVNQLAATSINVTSATYIFLAIA